jgi:quinol-cytochrome oxidoreductase complex cytochrome b subunit
MNPVLVGVILFVLWLFLPTRKQAPGESKRTPKWKITARMVIIPFAVVGFWGAMFCIADVGLGFCFVLGGVIAVALGLLVLLGFHQLLHVRVPPTRIPTLEGRWRRSLV